MDAFRRRYTEVAKANKDRDNLLNDLLQALDDVHKAIESNAFVLVLIDGNSLQVCSMNGLCSRALIVRSFSTIW